MTMTTRDHLYQLVDAADEAREEYRLGERITADQVRRELDR
jgi:hypothetical protein